MGNAESDVVSFQQQGDITVAALRTSEITPKVSDLLQARLDQMRNGGGAIKLVLDLSKLDFLGSVGLGSLVVFLQRVRKSQGHLALAGMTKLCRDVMRVTGLEKAFQIYQDVPGAIEALGQL
jgi:anti-anti-sigma factor